MISLSNPNALIVEAESVSAMLGMDTDETVEAS